MAWDTGFRGGAADAIMRHPLGRMRGESMTSQQDTERRDAAVLPLTGLRVIDLTWHVAGPFGTRRLADWGADVIKIERPGVGDPGRDIPPFYEDQPGLERSGLFMYTNLGKRSMTLDLKSERGRQIVLDLVKDADVLVESFRPRVMSSLGLDYETLREVNPRLIMTSISNYGQTGPYRDWEATEITSYAMGGAMINTGHPEREPLNFGGRVAAYQVGAVAAAATSIHLLSVEASGEGDHLDVGALPVWMGAIDRRQSYLMGYQYGGGNSTRPWPAGAIGSGTWICQDGYFMTTAGPAMFPRFMQMVGMGDLLQTPEWSTPMARSAPERLDESLAVIVPWMLERTKKEIRAECQKFGVLGGPINSFEDLKNDEHLQHREFFQEIDHPTTGPISYPGYHVKLHFADGSGLPARKRAPLLGEHTDEILRDVLGRDEAEIAGLRAEGVV